MNELDSSEGEDMVRSSSFGPPSEGAARVNEPTATNNSNSNSRSKKKQAKESIIFLDQDPNQKNITEDLIWVFFFPFWKDYQRVRRHDHELKRYFLKKALEYLKQTMNLQFRLRRDRDSSADADASGNDHEEDDEEATVIDMIQAAFAQRRRPSTISTLKKYPDSTDIWLGPGATREAYHQPNVFFRNLFLQYRNDTSKKQNGDSFASQVVPVMQGLGFYFVTKVEPEVETSPWKQVHYADALSLLTSYFEEAVAEERQEDGTTGNEEEPSTELVANTTENAPEETAQNDILVEPKKLSPDTKTSGRSAQVVPMQVEPVQVYPVFEAEPVRAVASIETTPNPNFPPRLSGDLADKSTSLTIHEKLLREIKTLDSVEACCDLYDSAFFQECLRLLRQSQDSYMAAASQEEWTKAREEWAKLWAIALSQDADWAWALNYCRRTVLKLLYKVCDLCTDPEDPSRLNQDLEEIFKARRVTQIMVYCVVMDRANALFNMKNDETGERGLGWYSKEDKDAYRMLRDPPLPLNPDCPTMNKRLKLVQRSGMYAPETAPWVGIWLEIEAPPGLL